MLLHDYLEFWARDDPDRLIYDDGRLRLSYGAVNAAADAFAELLIGRGLSPGDRIGAVATNRAEWLTFFYGAFKCGVVPVPLNARQHPREWLYQLNDAGARWCLAQDSFTTGIDEIRADLAVTDTFVTFDRPRPGWSALSDELARRVPVAVPPVLDHDSELYQVYTSGTTGTPKGAVLTHAAVDANVTQSRLRQAMRDGERFFTPMPLFHAGGAVRVFQVVAGGATLRLMARFEAADAVRIIDEESIHVATLVPAMIQRMLEVPGVAERRYSGLRTIVYGSSPISQAALSKAMSVFKCGFYQAYGQTEATSSVCGLSEQDHWLARHGRPELLASCGRPHAGTEIDVVDDDGRPVPTGTIGRSVPGGLN